MAIAKDIPEVYLCEYDSDRESIPPYAGQKCIMANGDIYICFTQGEWTKLGTEPTPPEPPVPTTYTVPFEIPSSWYTMVTDPNLGYSTPMIVKDSSIANITEGDNYKLTIYDINGTGYSATGQAIIDPDMGGMTLITFDFENSGLPAEIDDLIYGDEVIVLNDAQYPFAYGDGFLLVITFPNNITTVEQVTSVISKFYLEEA